MTTEAQAEADRANAQKATGPRTPEGKDTPRAPLRATAAQNALKHGLFAREGAIRGEDQGEFEEHRENLLRQLIPGTPLEEVSAGPAGPTTNTAAPGGAVVQTNPVLPAAECAKQTQFPAGPGGAGPEERGARNEMCKTNPIGGSARGYTPHLSPA